ncbi:nuclear transport factor 2 family protein [Brevibacterium sp. SMBL_HHYL_HB1]|uniref:nuclear transport factor 2 family protein n=1 Tax=Brevibacterium sp. SMBL_HHYL_HB1 TaxID=2777556 RepID=UPI001BA9DDFF|nr:nuclear transport factor 2 family protein [Brevibacterium sp. SMBL_HHYL_HB1]QUL80625.1 nuclear transport factor 2 family protein [Brevibacterium sp. SMBL_HHYL_HB1]
MVTFSEAVVAKDLDAVEDMLADEVVFTSPVAYRPYPGKAITISILRAVVEVFEDFKYIREIQDDHEHAYIFTAEINGLSVTGCDFLTFDEEGKIADFMVMVRPLKAAPALAAAMADRYPSIQEAAARIEETQGK